MLLCIVAGIVTRSISNIGADQKPLCYSIRANILTNYVNRRGAQCDFSSQRVWVNSALELSPKDKVLEVVDFWFHRDHTDVQYSW